MYSVMWSEHCSYKSSKVHLRYFGETTTEEMKAAMLAGIGENAGVVDIGDGWAVTFKVESHNHPSYVEPYQGAATGVGGIVRDIMAMGARPVAVMDQLRFGAADAPTPAGCSTAWSAASAATETPGPAQHRRGDRLRRLLRGQPAGQRAVPGVLRKEDLHLAFASGTGNKIILFGARTGLDGIGGVSVLASDTFSGDESADGGKTRKNCPACRSVTRSPRRCSLSAAWTCTRPGWWSASRTSAAPGCPAPPRSWPRPVTAGWPSSWTGCRCGRRA